MPSWGGFLRRVDVEVAEGDLKGRVTGIFFTSNQREKYNNHSRQKANKQRRQTQLHVMIHTTQLKHLLHCYTQYYYTVKEMQRRWMNG